MPFEGLAALVIDRTGWTYDYIKRMDARDLTRLLKAWEGIDLARGGPESAGQIRWRKR